MSLLWLPGYRSDMASTKATALAEFARQKGYGCTRFDYSGHGVSSGRFEDGTIGQWLAEAEAVFRRATRGPQIVIGSSMGGWIALLLLRRLLREAPAEAARIAGLVLIAPAWDMTEELMWKKFDAAARRDLEQTGVYQQPSEYGEPYAITRGLIEEGREHLLARRPFDPGRPVVILQGAYDAAVPIAHTRELMGFMQRWRGRPARDRRRGASPIAAGGSWRCCLHRSSNLPIGPVRCPLNNVIPAMAAPRAADQWHVEANGFLRHGPQRVNFDLIF